MMVLITYVVNSENAAGAKRLRHVAKACENYGQRVQKSVFECILEPAQFVALKNQLLGAISKDTDSIRFYLLGKKWETKIEHYGVTPLFEQGKTLIL